MGRPMRAQEQEQPRAQSESAATASKPEATSDGTEVGLAVDTGNYVALLLNNRLNQVDLPRKKPARATANSQQPKPSVYSNQLAAHAEDMARKQQLDTEDVVTGLPVNTNDYLQLLRVSNAEKAAAKNKQNQRQSQPDRMPEDVVVVKSSTGPYRVLHQPIDEDREQQPEMELRSSSDSGDSHGNLQDADQRFRRNAERMRRRVSAPTKLHLNKSSRSLTSGTTTGTGDKCVSAPMRHKDQDLRAIVDISNNGVGKTPFTGWLYFKRFSLWKKFYAVLSGVQFKYSKGPGHAPRDFGVIRAVRLWEQAPFGLILELTHNNVIYCRAEGSEQQHQWLVAIMEELRQAESLVERSRSKYHVVRGPNETTQYGGYLHVEKSQARSWYRCYVELLTDGHLICRRDKSDRAVLKDFGIIKSVGFANVHDHALVIQLETMKNVFVYAESYDECMIWYTSISTWLSERTSQEIVTVRGINSAAVRTARSNLSGYLYKKIGMFSGWKRLYFTLHGDEISFSRDNNCPVLLNDKVQSAWEWRDKPNGLLIKLKSGRQWKVYAESYDCMKNWLSIIQDAVRRQSQWSMRRYLAARSKRSLPAVFGGWLTTDEQGTKIRRYYVLCGNLLGCADDVDHQLQILGHCIDVGASRSSEYGISMMLEEDGGKRLNVIADSLDSRRDWYECLAAST